jgi:hypothetical protein
MPVLYERPSLAGSATTTVRSSRRADRTRAHLAAPTRCGITFTLVDNGAVETVEQVARWSAEAEAFDLTPDHGLLDTEVRAA